MSEGQPRREERRNRDRYISRHHVCPRCRGPVIRVHRTSLDRLICAVYPVRRYSCLEPGCEWNGLRPWRRSGRLAEMVPRWVWVAVVLVALAAAVILLRHLARGTLPR